MYAEILQHHPQLGTWQEVMRQSEENPTTVVRHLIDSQHFDLSRRWATLHGVEENEIEQNYLLMLLDMEETLQAHQVRDSTMKRPLTLGTNLHIRGHATCTSGYLCSARGLFFVSVC